MILANDLCQPSVQGGPRSNPGKGETLLISDKKGNLIYLNLNVSMLTLDSKRYPVMGEVSLYKDLA